MEGTKDNENPRRWFSFIYSAISHFFPSWWWWDFYKKFVSTKGFEIVFENNSQIIFLQCQLKVDLKTASRHRLSNGIQIKWLHLHSTKINCADSPPLWSTFSHFHRLLNRIITLMEDYSWIIHCTLSLWRWEGAMQLCNWKLRFFELLKGNYLRDNDVWNLWKLIRSLEGFAVLSKIFSNFNDQRLIHLPFCWSIIKCYWVYIQTVRWFASKISILLF